jgi:hypothetical protein
VYTRTQPEYSLDDPEALCGNASEDCHNAGPTTKTVPSPLKRAQGVPVLIDGWSQATSSPTGIQSTLDCVVGGTVSEKEKDGMGPLGAEEGTNDKDKFRGGTTTGDETGEVVANSLAEVLLLSMGCSTSSLAWPRSPTARERLDRTMARTTVTTTTTRSSDKPQTTRARPCCFCVSRSRRVTGRRWARRWALATTSECVLDDVHATDLLLDLWQKGGNKSQPLSASSKGDGGTGAQVADELLEKAVQVRLMLAGGKSPWSGSLPRVEPLLLLKGTVVADDAVDTPDPPMVGGPTLRSKFMVPDASCLLRGPCDPASPP